MSSAILDQLRGVNTAIPVSGGGAVIPNPLPVTGTVAVSNLPATQPISAVALPLPAGASTAANQLPNNHDVTVSNFPATQPISGIVSLQGQLDNGNNVQISATAEGHMEVAIHHPLGAFGGVKVATDTPLFQVDAVYGLIQHQVSTTTSGAGTVTGNGLFQCKTNGGVGALGVLQSKARARYRPGQGLCCRFTAAFTAGVVGSYQVIGFGHAEDGLYVGYNGTQFGFLYSKNGARTIQKVTITAGASVAGSVLINGTAVAVTNSANINRTAYEMAAVKIPNYSYPTVETSGGTTFLYYVGNSAVDLPVITFDANGTGATATVVKTRAGAAATDTWIYQANWNNDTFNGLGPSGVTLDPTKLNVYEFSIQYLGAGAITLFIETAVNGNNPTFVAAHSLSLPNTLTTPSFSTPAFPFTIAAYDLGVGTNVTASSASGAALLEGPYVLTGSRGCYWSSKASVTAASYQPLFTICNPIVYNGKANQCQIILTQIDCASDANNPVVFALIKTTNQQPWLNLVGNPSFVPYDSTDMLALIDTSATSLTLGDNSQIQWIGLTGGTGNANVELATFVQQFALQPGESMSLCTRSISGTAAFAAASLVWREDV